MNIIDRDFFARPTLDVARDLLGQRLVRVCNGERLSGIIVETEAYVGPTDTACHAAKGRTPRTEVMFGPPGHAYVYLIYGMYNMLNLVTEQPDFPAAVLIRAIEPVEGVEMMQSYRQRNGRSSPRLSNLTSGPGKLCQALQIDKWLNSWDVTVGQDLWLEATAPVSGDVVATGPRVGINYADVKDREAPWRFWIKGNRFVSG